MALSYEEGMATLRSIFPEWEPGVLAQLLEANEGHLENTIDMALSMEPPRAERSPTPTTTPTPTLPPAPTQRLASPTSRGRRSPRASPRDKQRSVRVKLPDDFLRLPGWDEPTTSPSEQERQDALLAQMLQDEMFREQLMEDEEFSSHFQNGGARRSSVSGPREKSATEIANETFNAMSAKFSVMSEAMKKKAHEMYLKFQTRADAPSKQDPYSHRPLMAGDSSDEEDDYQTRGSTTGDMRHRPTQDAMAHPSTAFSPRARSSFTSRRSTTGNKKDD